MDWTKGREGDLGRDVELEEQLRVLDPSQDDPSYWFRFRGWVMKEAEGELARRRMRIHGWWRTGDDELRQSKSEAGTRRHGGDTRRLWLHAKIQV